MKQRTRKRAVHSHSSQTQKSRFNYKIVIPSYKRETTLRDKTLQFLQRQGIPAAKIHIFVANEEEKKKYQETLPPYYHQIIVGVVGMKNIRNFIADYFPAGSYLFNMDDDISGMLELLRPKDEKRKIKPTSRQLPKGHLDKMITTGFQECRQHGLSLFGIYPACNPFFMKKRITHDLRYIIGSCWGCILDPSIKVTMDDKEDFERTIKYYLRDSGVVRIEYITAQTGYYKEKGGMQETRTKERVERSARLLVKRYPQLCSLNEKRKSGFMEITLRRTPQM